MNTMKTISAIFLFFSLFTSSFAQSPGEQTSDELLASQLMAQGDFERAAILYEELFENNPTPLIYNNYLRSLIELEDFRKAEQVVNTQIANNPGRVRFEVDLGFVFDRAGDQRRLRRQMERLIRDVAPHPPSITDLANAFMFRGFDDYALETFLKGRQLIGSAYPFHLQVGAIYERRGDYQNMAKEYVELAILDDSWLEQVQGLLQEALNNDPDFMKSDALRRVLLQGSQRNPSQTMYAELLMWMSIQQKDFEMALRQARALDRRQQGEGKLVMEVAKLSAANNRYDIARQSFEYVIGLGDLTPHFLEATVGLLNVKYAEATSGYEINYDLLREVELEYTQTIDRLGLRPQTVSLIRNLANLKAFYLNNVDEAAQLLQAVIDLPNVSNRVRGECRVELADILILKGQLWDAHLLYAQVDKTFRDDPLGHEARFKNARLSFYMGEFKWARAQLDILKAATSRLIANDAMALSILIQDNLDEEGNSVPLSMFARAEMHTFMNNFNKALDVLDSLENMFSSHGIIDDVLMVRAGILLRQGQYQEADKAYNRIATDFGKGLHASDALFRRALLHERVFNDKEYAMELYTQIMVNYPGSLRNADARNRFRYLRGDISSEDIFFYYGI